ncbi:hypothetical protein ANRL4_04536 [Anaerolineae bacterium]|nr:hypothetical protein ANRL4_04536 [Anaerolineae bacterium]
MFKRLLGFLRFPLADQLLVIKAWLLLLWFDGLLRLLPYERVQQFAQARSVRSSPEDPLTAARRLHALIGIASKRFFQPMTCLRRSLVLQFLLSRRGIKGEMQFGAKLEQGTLIAHAWIELEGQPIGESLSHLNTLARLQKGGLHGRHVWDRES